MIVAFDACTIIYLVEGGSALAKAALARAATLLRRRAARIVCSRLARMECRVGPLRAGDAPLLARYDEFFRRRRVGVADVTAAVIERATDLRAHHGFRAVDAIHLATAIEAGAGIFLTGDAALARCPGLRVEVLHEKPEADAP